MAVAENKYNLALVQTKTEKKIQPQPWYKERLRTKYVKALKPTDTSQHLLGKNWMFVKDGLDDFRDGLPPAVEGSDFIKTDKGPGPTITGSGSAGITQSVKEPAQDNRFTKHQICYSRITPLQQQRREHIDEIEYGLLQHPLALYPHLEESVPPEMFEDIVDILDPEMNLMEEEDQIPEEEEEAERQTAAAAATAEEAHPASARSMDDSTGSEREDPTAPRNPYRWLPRKEEKEKEKKDRRSVRDRTASSPSEEEHIQKVTRDFCQWVADLGGESNNIEESTITSLFASGYETKPALSVPIHVVELTNVPPELRMSATVPQHQQGHQHSATKATPPAQKTEKEWKVSGEYQPSWIKFKYGAWYLPPKTWQKRDYYEPLVDPKELKDQEMSEAKKKSHRLNQELSSMHASKAFMDFISKKSVRKPEFLEEVGEIQRKAAEEEQKRLEAELLAKQKKSGTGKSSHKV
ncbi:protein FAM47E-like [Babylonia areolata]|uniref:protein FAM47E-like n=1 Tax=Babylonia areolata TaxID=304850 RepID=UPI003FD66B3E